MDFDWTKPMKIDWSGRSGPLFTDHALENCVIKRIINNTYCAPFCDKKYIRAVPKWNPRDLLENMHEWNEHGSYRRFVPGELPLPAYPQVSTLTQLQHQQGVRVLSTQYENVQPHHYAKPTKMDHSVFQEIKELYETEQQQYLQWAKLLWQNGGCIQALHPKPILEQVYEAEFKMRAHEVKSWPQNFALAAQIPLENNNDSFEMEHKANLLNVNVQDLPIADYPRVMEKPLSILLDTCPTPEPCIEHICKFILPHEDSMSNLPLSEIHRELANFAISHECSVIASENALHCLLETDRKWHIPVSVIQVVSPGYGDRTVVVLGNEFPIQKSCAAHRTYRAYKHLLRETFAPLKAQNDHQQNANAKTTKPVNVSKIKANNKKDDLDKQLVDRSKPNRMVNETTDKHPETNKVNDDPHKFNFNECEVGFSSDTKRMIIADTIEHRENANTTKTVNGTKIKVTNKKDDLDKQLVDRSEPNRLVDETTDKNPEINNVNDDPHKYNFDESEDGFSSDADRLIIADTIEHRENANAKTTQPGNVTKINVSNKGDDLEKQLVGRSEPSRLLVDETTDKHPSINNEDDDYHEDNFNESDDDFSSDTERLTIADPFETILEPSCRHDAAEPRNDDKEFTAPGYDHLDRSKKLYSPSTTSKNVKPTLCETNKDADTTLLEVIKNSTSKSDKVNQNVDIKWVEMTKNTASKSNEANQGVAPILIEMDKSTASMYDAANQGVAPILIDMDQNTASKSNEANQGVAPILIEMDKSTASMYDADNQGVAPILIDMDQNTASKSNEGNQGVGPILIEMDKSTASMYDAANQGVAPILIDMDQNTASKSNEANQGVAPILIEMDKSTASMYDAANQGVAPILIDMDQNTASKSNEANQGVAPILIEMDKYLTPMLKTNDVTSNLLETNINHTSPTNKLETTTCSCRACSHKSETGKVSNSSTKHIPHINPSLLKTQTSEMTNTNLPMASGTNTSENNEQKAVSRESGIKRKLGDSESLLTTGLANKIANELTSKEAVSGPSAGKRVRSLVDRVYLDHNYFELSSETLESTESKSQVIIDEAYSDQSSPGDNRTIHSIPKPCVRKLSTLSKRKKPNAPNPKPVQNVDYHNPKSGGKSKPWKICFSEIFGDDSDCEEAVHNTSDSFNNAKEEKKITNASHDHKKNISSKQKAKLTDNILDFNETIRKTTKTYSRKKGFSDPLSELSSIESCPQSPCLRNTTLDRPANPPRRRLASRSKTKLRDTIASASKHSLRSDQSVSQGSDSEEGILGFNDDVAVPIRSRLKGPKKLTISKCKGNTFSRIHKRNNKKPKHETKPNKTVQNEINDGARSGWNSCAEESDNSITDMKIKVAAKRSRRLSTRLQVEECDDPNKKKNSKQNDTNPNNAAPRRSQRLSTRLQPEQSEDQTKKKSNNQELAKTKNVALRRSRRLSTHSQEKSKTNKTIEEDILNLSDRTKRFLRRSLKFNSSDTDGESEEMSEETKRYPRGSTLSACSSDAESTAEMNIFHFTKTNDTDSDDSDSENSLTIDCPELHSTEERQVTDVGRGKDRSSGGETGETEMVTSQLECHSASDTSSTPPVTSPPQVEVKQVDAARTLPKCHVRSKEGGRDRKLSSSEQLLLQNETLKNANTLSKDAVYDVIGVNSCTCKGTKFAVPPPRSFKKWQLKNKTSHAAFDIIVHSSHKVRKGNNEVLLEPIVEFQPDLGGTRQSESKIRALTLSLMMRPLAQLVNVRVNHASGEVLVVEELSGGELAARRGDARRALAAALHAALAPLRYLLPGQYVLAHDMSHGANAMLYSTKGLSAGHVGERLRLRCGNINMPDAEEAACARAPPALAPVLLPYHKSRRLLPLAFTPKKKEVKAAKKMTAALAKVKLPPHGIKWPKKKRKKSKKPRQNREQNYVEPEI